MDLEVIILLNGSLLLIFCSSFQQFILIFAHCLCCMLNRVILHAPALQSSLNQHEITVTTFHSCISQNMLAINHLQLFSYLFVIFTCFGEEPNDSYFSVVVKIVTLHYHIFKQIAVQTRKLIQFP